MATNKKTPLHNETLFSAEEWSRITPGELWYHDPKREQPVTVLGHTFKNDDERRQWFREELRKKLPELKQMEGYPIGEDDDIINLSDPPYYTACPNPWTNEIIKEWEKDKGNLLEEGKRRLEFKIQEPYSKDISVGKNDPIYTAHSYHTKVPHKAIMKLLYYYTQPGDIIYDGFAGTGMTGIAAGMCKFGATETSEDYNVNGTRHAICNDLSPIASFIAYNLNNNTSKDLDNFPYILEKLKEDYGSLYRTKHTNGEYGEIVFMVWSDIVVCENCGGESKFMDLFSRIGEGRIDDEAYCPHCGAKIRRKSCKKQTESYYDKYIHKNQTRVKSVPYLIVYFYNGHKYKKVPDQEDIDLVAKIYNMDNNSWVPIVPLGDGDKMEDPKAKGIFYIHQLYTDRTLFLLSKLWERCSTFNRFFITTSIARNLTKLNRFIVNKYNMNGRINGPLTGTLYVPSEVVEQNIFDLLTVKRSNISEIGFNNIIETGDALHNPLIPDNSIDYIFTDPPFGDNIMYSELNRISESWLKVITNSKDEAISNKTQHKTANVYMGLMSQAFADYFRVLKPGNWMTVEFSNTKSSIWNAIQTSIQNAGFVIASVSGFDKVHGGLKSMRYTTAVKEDLIITCYKPNGTLLDGIKNKHQINIWEFITDHLMHLPVHVVKNNKTTSIIERDSRILYDRMVSYYVVNNIPIPVGMSDFQKGLREHFLERDGMFFTAHQAAEYEEKKSHTSEFVPMGLIVSDEANGIEWLKHELKEPKTYQEISPEWMAAINGQQKGDVIPELKTILEENFIEDEQGKWHVPDLEKAIDLEKLHHKSLMREFNLYKEQAQKPRARIREVRVEALREGFKECFKDKDFQTILLIADKIPQNILTEDEQLLQYYDIASMRA